VTLPPEFVRVRYYYGQRLGVMELADQTAYHSGKLTFHSARLHGVGVICGLRAERMPPVAGAMSRMLRVHRGAALDACGREVIVGVDQCIDVAAWFMRVKGRPELAPWVPGSAQTLRVAIRYNECPTDPGPAPRDACGCDSGGCEYGRVREGFELALHVPGAGTDCAAQSAVVDALLAELRGVGTQGADAAAALDRRIATVVADNCPDPSDHEWLCLATLRVTLDAAGVPADIGAIDNAIPERQSLLPTAALQRAVLALAASASDSGMVGTGPRAGAVAFVGTAADAGDLTVPITLGHSGSPAVDTPLEASTLDAADVAIRRLDAGVGWVDITPPAASITLVAAPPAIKITFANGLAAGKRYRLAIEPPPSDPIADTLGRPLTPLPLVRSFAFVASGGTLILDPAL
jgi:hypothetical protein